MDVQDSISALAPIRVMMNAKELPYYAKSGDLDEIYAIHSKLQGHYDSALDSYLKSGLQSHQTIRMVGQIAACYGGSRGSLKIPSHGHSAELIQMFRSYNLTFTELLTILEK